MWQFEHVDVYPSELYHYGRKGMKWYQNIFTKGKEAIAARKAKKEENDSEKKDTPDKQTPASKSAPDTPAPVKSLATQKEEILRSGNAETIFKNAHLFTTQELSEASNRLNYLSQIQGKIPVEESKGKKFMDELPNNLNKINKISDEGIHLYNNVARVLTAWTGTEVPVVGESGKVWAMQTKLKNDKKKAAEEENKTEAEADKKAKEAADNLKKAQQEVDDYNRKQAQYQKDVDDNNRMHTDLNNARRAARDAKNNTDDSDGVAGYLPGSQLKLPSSKSDADGNSRAMTVRKSGDVTETGSSKKASDDTKSTPDSSESANSSVARRTSDNNSGSKSKSSESKKSISSFMTNLWNDVDHDNKIAPNRYSEFDFEDEKEIRDWLKKNF